jgi:C4-dicarboxylate-specific signal transduction histidine kinase
MFILFYEYCVIEGISSDGVVKTCPIGGPEYAMSNGKKSESPEQLAHVEHLLEHFEQIENQFKQVRAGLMHSHRLATLGTIASIIAHEYNNILTPVISYGQLALASPEDQELMKKAVQKAVSGAERAASISNSLLGFAREADQEHVADIQEVVRDTIMCLGRDPKKDGVDLVVDVPEVKVSIPPVNLQQVLMNLVLNAMQAMKGRGRGSITITGRVDGAAVRVDVTDTGPGIPGEVSERLFEPFVTHSHANNPTRKGTGLGLWICRDLIQSIGGEIEVESVQGKGTTFHLTLPVAADVFEST